MASPTHLLAMLAGLGTGLSLIVAIGAQNAFVLRQGLRGEHIGLVVTACAISDVVLIAAGVAGAGALIASTPALLDLARYGGAAFLLAYAALALRRAARHGDALEVDGLTAAAATTAPAAITTAAAAVGPDALPTTTADTPAPAAFTTAPAAATTATAAPAATPADALTAPSPTTPASAILATTLALTWLNPHVYLDTLVLVGSLAASHGDERWWFAAGAGAASILWFTALGHGAALLRPVFARPRAWQVLDGLIALCMTSIAIGLLHGA